MENFDWLQLALIVLVVAGIWAVVELALMLRRTRGVVSNLDTSVDHLNATLAEAQPIMAKLDGAVDELQPAMAQLEPILKNVNVSVESLNANLVEIEGVVRDVSTVTGTAGNAASAVNSLTDSAQAKVSQFLGRRKVAEPERTLEEPAATVEPPAVAEGHSVPSTKSYYTYGDDASAGDSNE